MFLIGCARLTRTAETLGTLHMRQSETSLFMNVITRNCEHNFRAGVFVFTFTFLQPLLFKATYKRGTKQGKRLSQVEDTEKPREEMFQLRQTEE